jgi:hypothetical protein
MAIDFAHDIEHRAQQSLESFQQTNHATPRLKRMATTRKRIVRGSGSGSGGMQRKHHHTKHVRFQLPAGHVDKYTLGGNATTTAGSHTLPDLSLYDNMEPVFF